MSNQHNKADYIKRITKIADWLHNNSGTYSPGMNNFESYFLRRFKENSPTLFGMYEELSVAADVIFDIGAGLCQWSLPGIYLNENAALYAFDNHPVIVRALNDLKANSLLDERVFVKSEGNPPIFRWGWK